jgi:PTH2 family peptidyl-tRNA hydrolase
MTSLSLPLHTSLILYTCIAGVAGYFLGAYASCHAECDCSEGDAEGEDGFADSNEECKMVFVIRTDLQMSKGKAAAQCAHAAIACYESAMKSTPKLLQRWRRAGQAKVTLQCSSEDDLRLLQGIAISKGVTAKTVVDAGRTQIAAGSTTVLGIGPAPKSAIDQVTGHLKLY